MEKENKLIKYLESIQVGNEEFGGPALGPEELKNELVQKLLFCFDEFKNVKKINVLEYPMYLGDNETGAPIECDENNLGDTRGKNYTVPTFNYNPNRDENFEFNEEIDVYSISLSPKIYDPKELTASNLGVGIWVFPVMYNAQDFTPLKEVKVVFSSEGIQDILRVKNKEDAAQEVKKRLMKSFEASIDNGLLENVPFKRSVFFRVSQRSVKK